MHAPQRHGFAELLTNEGFEVAGAAPDRLLPRHPHSSKRLLSAINDILDLATIEAGYMTLETARLDIRDMLDPVLTAAPQQAHFNLVSNAILFTPP